MVTKYFYRYMICITIGSVTEKMGERRKLTLKAKCNTFSEFFKHNIKIHFTTYRRKNCTIFKVRYKIRSAAFNHSLSLLLKKV